LFNFAFFAAQIKDPNSDKPRNLPAPGLGSESRPSSGTEDKTFTQSDYVVQPKVPQLQVNRQRKRPGSDVRILKIFFARKNRRF
jgi:hypothetical protein